MRKTGTFASASVSVSFIQMVVPASPFFWCICCIGVFVARQMDSLDGLAKARRRRLANCFVGGEGRKK